MKKKNKEKRKHITIEQDMEYLNKMNEHPTLVRIQLILTILTIIFLFISVFKNNYLTIFQIILGIDMMVVGYNEYVVFSKSKIKTIIYEIIGVLLVVLGILSIIGV